MPVTKNRMVAAVIGAAYRLQLDPNSLTPKQWTEIVEFVRLPAEFAKSKESEWPQSKGRWDGKKGYRVQMEAMHRMIEAIVQ